jgi:hypothetical protein
MVLLCMVMMNTPKGVEPTRGDSGSVPPPLELLRCSMFLYFRSPRHHALGTPRGTFLWSILGEDKENHVKTDGIGRSRRKRAQVAWPGYWAAPLVLFPRRLTSCCPTLAHFVLLEISEPCSWILPFLSPVAPRKTKTLIEAIF